MLLKAVIVERGGKISDSRTISIGSSEALRKCVSNADFKCVTEEQAISIQNLNLLRDAAQHYIVSVSEGQLYIYAQSAISIYLSILKNEFGIERGEKFPDRLSLVGTAMPSDFSEMLDQEFEAIKQMLVPGSRKRLDAKSKIRAVAVLDRSLSGSELHHSDGELERLAKQIAEGRDWRELFPGVRTIRVDPEGTDVGLVLRIAKGAKGENGAVALVPPDTPGAAVVGVKKINDLSYYSLYFKDLVTKLTTKHPALNRSDVQSMIRDSNIKEDREMYKEFQMGSQCHKRYSPKALDALMKLAVTHAKVAI